MNLRQYDFRYRNSSPRFQERLRRKYPRVHRQWIWYRAIKSGPDSQLVAQQAQEGPDPSPESQSGDEGGTSRCDNDESRDAASTPRRERGNESPQIRTTHPTPLPRGGVFSTTWHAFGGGS